MGDVTVVACLRDFTGEVTWPWAPTKKPFLAQRFLEARLSSECLEPLIGFLAYL